MKSRKVIARVIATSYLVIGSATAFYLVYLAITVLREKQTPILLIILAPSIVIAITMIIVYRIFFKYSEASLASLSGLLGVTAFYISGILLKHPFDKINENRGTAPWHLLADLSPILIGYFAYRLAKFYFLHDFKRTCGNGQNRVAH